MPRNFQFIAILGLIGIGVGYLSAREQPAVAPVIRNVQIDVSGSTLSINGYDFGDYPPLVSLDMAPLTVLPGSTTNAVFAVLPPFTPGTYLLVLERSDTQAAGVFYVTLGGAAPAVVSGFPSASSSAPAAGTTSFGDSAALDASAALVEDPTNTFLGSGAGESAVAFTSSSGFGADALRANTTGQSNTGVGRSALRWNTTGERNTAIGRGAMFLSTTGLNNTATGHQALYHTTGSNNAGTGMWSLHRNTTGHANTAVGANAMQENLTGALNAAQGHLALQLNTTGNGNTAMGYQALLNNTAGSWNVAIGIAAGINATGSNNIYLKHIGVAGESNTIRIGDASHTTTFLAGTVEAPAFKGDGSELTGVPAVYQ